MIPRNFSVAAKSFLGSSYLIAWCNTI